MKNFQLLQSQSLKLESTNLQTTVLDQNSQKLHKTDFYFSFWSITKWILVCC